MQRKDVLNMSFRKIAPQELSENMIRVLKEEWMLLAAGDRQASNAMTVGWGGMGVIWQLPVATCYVRPQRYTYDFTEKSDYFTLSAFDPEYREQMLLMGTKSGRDMDKAAACGFTTAYAAGDAPYYEQARFVLVCKKLYVQDMEDKCILDERVRAVYPEKDYHRIYVGEIVEVLVKED